MANGEFLSLNHLTKINRAIGVCMAAILIAFACAVTASTVISESAYAETATNNQTVKWVTKNSNIYCKVNGKTQKGGIKTIDGKKYLFSKNGKQLTSWHKIGKSYFYFKPKTKADGFMVTSKVINGIKLDKNGRAVLNSEARKELNILTRATKLVEKHTRAAWSEKKKLRKIFNLLRDTYNECAIRPFSSKYGWYRRFALDILVNKTGSCHSYASAYAYIANAIGVKNCKIVSSGGHSWTELNGNVYDAEWSRHQRINLFDIPYSRSGKGGVQAYGACRYYIVTVAPNARQFKTNTRRSYFNNPARTTSGLVKKKGKRYFVQNGKTLKSQWMTWKGATYYFKGNGVAATGPAKVKGKRYMFSAIGKLFKGSKTRIVSYKGSKYQVSKDGRAKSGWDKAKKHRFAKDGKMYTGDCIIGGKFYAFSAKGLYNKERTSQLQGLARLDSDAAPLLAMLGKPKKSFYEISCNVLYDANGKPLNGLDGILKYANFTVYTFKGDNGIEYFRGADAN